MTIPLKYATASQEIPLGYFLDIADGNTEETGLTIANTDIKLWKNGATTLANKNSGGATHISNGIYYAVLDATDTNTYGPMVIFIHITATALPVRLECNVMNVDAYNALYAANGTGSIETNVTDMDAAIEAEIADVHLNRDMSLVSDTNARSPLNALRFLRNKWTVIANALTVYKENDTTTAWSGTVATSPGDPTDSVDPA